MTSYAQKSALVQQQAYALTRRVDAFKTAFESGDPEFIRNEFTAMMAANDLCKEALAVVVDGEDGA